MLVFTPYKDIEEVLKYFIDFLPEPQSKGISSVVKYARIDNENVILRAKKSKSYLGFSWNFEITVGGV
ncbi:hypothetical protein ACFSJU_03485 [Paradesertivirga mongoliensis]|uniref:Uncharacterized protein n=1 Tax=Paradesertivirga mongoliensis TaxID=2100740 RepID=A0ABW4ZHK0_9SPHI|nr:hypothetical protein [Pedobacter mongoliensis]